MSTFFCDIASARKLCAIRRKGRVDSFNRILSANKNLCQSVFLHLLMECSHSARDASSVIDQALLNESGCQSGGFAANIW
jgi:hypothetical protein